MVASPGLKLSVMDNGSLRQDSATNSTVYITVNAMIGIVIFVMVTLLCDPCPPTITRGDSSPSVVCVDSLSNTFSTHQQYLLERFET